MSKPALYIGLGVGAVALAYLGYKFMLQPTQNYQTTSLNPYSDQSVGNFQTSPQQSYPFQPNQPPRVDNSNQPWANNNRGAIAQASNPQFDVNFSNVQMLAGYAKSGAEIAKGLTSIWDDLGVSSWFDSSDPSGFDVDVDPDEWNISQAWDSENFSWSV